MTEQLKREAIDFLSQVESEAKAVAEVEYNARVSAMEAEYAAKIDAAYRDGYDKARKEAESVDDPVHEGYSRDKAVAELLAIKGSKSCAFGIVDTKGNVYADVSEWILDSKPNVLGIGYTDGIHHLCMLPKKIASSPLGGSGAVDAYTTKKQWRNSSTKDVAAFDDYEGVSNTFGHLNASDNTIAAKCYEVVAANGNRGYLPACAEQRVYCKYYKTVDALLTAIGGDALKTQNGAQLLWSSTCRDNTHAWAVRYMAEGDAQPQYNAKTKSLPCRVFVEL